MKIRVLAAAVLAAFILSVSFNTFAQTDTKTVDKKVQTTDKKASKIDKNMKMKKTENTDKTMAAPKTKKMVKPNLKTSKTVSKKVKTPKTDDAAPTK